MKKLSNDMVKGLILGQLVSCEKMTLDDLCVGYGEVLRTFAERGYDLDELKNVYFLPQLRILGVLKDLKQEGLIEFKEITIPPETLLKGDDVPIELSLQITLYALSLGVGPSY